MATIEQLRARLEYLRNSQAKIDHMMECERKHAAIPFWRIFARKRAFDAWTVALEDARRAVELHDALWPGH